MNAIRACLAGLIIAGAALAAEPATQVGPANGSLLVVGGGSMAKLWPVFLELAGGNDAPIVVIPTAGENITGDDSAVKALRALGVARVVQLHTRDPKEADTEVFTAPLRAARGAWISGGRQWRLADAYLGTRTQRELFALLARGGVIGGSSAGATIQGSYLVRGAPSGNRIMMSPGHEVGFGFLRGTAIDQHVDTRQRAEDLRPVLRAHPALLGIALDEATALIVRGDRADIVGAGSVRFFAAPEAPAILLRAGATYDLAARKTIVSGAP
ncbi:MAG: cyanophycinase [Opitutaceae bacterium]|nr:cyanophycinase [Opitutaceae bacterium]